MISKIPEWTKDIMFLIILIFMIVNESGRIQNSEDVKRLEFKQRNIEDKFQEFSKEHEHIYSTGKPRLNN